MPDIIKASLILCAGIIAGALVAVVAADALEWKALLTFLPIFG